MESPGSNEPGEYRFGDIVVQPHARRVCKGGAELRLEPKAYAVLVELLRHPHVVLERDRLLDAVWGHRFVTPGVLNRIIAILRRSLGDDAEQPRYIRTVHGVGYSFIGPLATDGEPPLPHQDRGGSPAPVPHSIVGGKRWAWGTGSWVAALAVLAFVGLLAARHWTEARGQASDPADPEVIRLAMLPISAVDPSDEILARGLTDVLGEALARIPDVELVELESARLAIARTQVPAEIAGLLRTDRLLRMRLGRESDDAVLSVELLSGRDGHATWSSRFVQPRNALTGIVGPLLDSLRAELLPGAPNSRVDPIVRAAAVAQALYLESRAARAADAKDRARNLALLEQAVREDPGFALGWAALANAHRLRYQYEETDIDEAMTAAQEAVDRALSLDPDLVEALLVQCAIKTNQWRSPEALGPSRRAIELAPNDARAVAMRANVLGYLARPREAIELRRRAVTLNPLSAFPVWTMATDYLMLGDRERALEQLAEALRMQGSVDDVGAFGARLDLAFGRPAESVIRYHRYPGQARSYGLYIPSTAVQALALIGETAQAESLLDSLHPPLPQAPIYLDARMTVFWSQGRFAEAVAWLDGPGHDSAQRPWLTVARAHARALVGDLDGALADYASGLEGPADRELIFNNWWPTRFGAAQLGNWIALRKAAGKDYGTELQDLANRLQRARTAGMRVPVLGYHLAILAALRDDPKAADAALTEARNSGWFDPLALDVDLAWRPYRNEGWFIAQQRWLAEKAERERARLVAGMP